MCWPSRTPFVSRPALGTEKVAIMFVGSDLNAQLGGYSAAAVGGKRRCGNDCKAFIAPSMRPAPFRRSGSPSSEIRCLGGPAESVGIGRGAVAFPDNLISGRKAAVGSGHT